MDQVTVFPPFHYFISVAYKDEVADVADVEVTIEHNLPFDGEDEEDEEEYEDEVQFSLFIIITTLFFSGGRH